MNKKAADTTNKSKDAHDESERRVTAADLRRDRIKAKAYSRIAEKCAENGRAKAPLRHLHPITVDVLGCAELLVARALEVEQDIPRTAEQPSAQSQN